MKNKLLNIISFALLILTFSVFISCEKPVDLVTDGVKTGGLVEPTAIIPFKLGLTTSADIYITVPKGSAIKSIEVTKQYLRSSDTTYSNSVVVANVSVEGANAEAEIEKVLNYTWANLIEGIVLPTDPQIPATDIDSTIADFIGDSWTFSYVVTMMDGSVIVNNNTTNVAIANFFAGKYRCVGVFYHPVNGPRDIDKDKNLVALGATVCRTELGDLGGSGYYLDININPTTYAITLTGGPAAVIMGDPADPTHGNTYDPATGIIELWYYYVGGTGNRVVHEVYTPK